MAGYAPFLHFLNPLHVTFNPAIHSQSASLWATGRAPLAAALSLDCSLTKERQTNGLPAPWGHNILPSRFAIKSLLINMLACHPDPESIDSKRLNQIAPPLIR